jgi:hypothetical protein
VTADQLDTLILAHYETTGNGSSAAAAAFKTDLFSRTMQTVTSLDDFVDNKFLRDYALTAIGLDPLYVADEAVRTALTADPNDSDGPLSTLDPAFRTLRAAFNFAADGGIDGDVVQTAEQLKPLTDSYFANYANKAVDDEEGHANYVLQDHHGCGYRCRSVPQQLKRLQLCLKGIRPGSERRIQNQDQAGAAQRSQ